MKILFNPPPEEQGSGTTSFISYTNRHFKEFIENFVQLRDVEEISQLEITTTGITIIFEVKR
jgi:hypothetical protein